MVWGGERTVEFKAVKAVKAVQVPWRADNVHNNTLRGPMCEPLGFSLSESMPVHGPKRPKTTYHLTPMLTLYQEDLDVTDPF